MGLGVFWKHPPPLPHWLFFFFFLKLLEDKGVASLGPEQCSRLAQPRTRRSHPAVQVPSPACLATPQAAGQTSLH